MEQRSTIWWESTWSEQFLPCFWLPYPYVWLASTWHPSLLPLEKTLLIAAGAQAYGRWLVPCILGYAFMMPLIKFCQSQHIVFPLMCCTTEAFLLQFPMCFLFITKLKLGYQGGAMLTSISIVLDTGIHATFLQFSSKCKKSLKSFLIKALHDLTGFSRWLYPLLS
jgi:MATE family multidrug resistance protein